MHDSESFEHASEPVVEPESVESEQVIDLGAVAMSETEPVLELSYPTVPPVESAPAEQAPPGLAVDAFRDIKPVSFGGFAAGDDEPSEPEAQAPTPPVDVIPEPVVDVVPAPEPVVDVVPAPEPVVDVTPDPEPEPIELISHPAMESEPIIEIEPEPEPIELISHPAMESEPVIEIEPEPIAMPESGLEPEPEFEAYEPYPDEFAPVAAAVAVDEAPAEPRSKRRLKLPNPHIRLPKLSLSRKSSGADTPAKKSFLTLPENLQGPLNDVERKIALGSVVAVVAAAAFGYMSAPSDDVASPTPPAAPAAASR